MQKVAKIWANFLLNYSVAPKGDFSGKFDYHNLCLYSRPHHPTTFQTNTRLHNFGQNWVQIVHLHQRRFFGKIDCYCYMPTVFIHATTFPENSQRANNKTEGYIILAQTGCELPFQKGFFWKRWPTLFLSSYCTPSCYVISKYLSQSRS